MEALSVCPDHCKVIGCRIRGEGVTVALGEMDVARVNPNRFGPSQPPVRWAWFQPRWPTAVTPFRGRLEVCLLPGGRRPPGQDFAGHRGMGNDGWREKRDRMCHFGDFVAAFGQNLPY